ncbi:ribonuclease R [Reyranella sp. CPCC 100927]|uniref:ribonuclease R n=1 Tax=Reyranella sp. CPCC 100927 TaxID=2599616 RepID=UPI0011B76949|nr:ribonuclease R [Reyranella sp. CPCC 100927]TWT10189.1 ribonuclease R [Reyranella sp. CPCC 100927]
MKPKKQTTPLPTRDQILAFIRESPVPVGKREIAKAFNIKGADRVGLKELLRDLRADGAVARGTRRELMDPGALPEYLVIEVIGPDADGDLLARPVHWNPDDGAAPPEIIVQPTREHAAPGAGDRLLARLRKRGQRRYDAQIVRKVGHGPRRILGVVEMPRGARNAFVRPTDRKLRYEIEVAPRDLNDAVDGDVVWVEPMGGHLARRGRVLEKVGTLRDPRAVSLIAIAANDIPVEFPEAALVQAREAVAAPLGDRVDMRGVPFVTIDGEDARDFDDAVWAEPDSDPANPGGWHLSVAIADVAWYVRPDDALDRAAVRRGNSVYFPDRVVPMLPEELSNGWCSLRPHEDRPTLVAEMWIDAAGHLKRHRFHRALIRSAARLTYTRMQQARDGHPDGELLPLMNDVVAPLYGAYATLLQARQARGTIDLDLPERLVSLDETGRIASIRLRERFDSHRLIEEFMILANVAAAETLERRHQPCMYRVHAPPDAAKVQALREFLATLGIGLPPGLNLQPRDFEGVLRKAAGQPYERLVHETILRSQSQAVYSPENVGHFGLALRRYAHFTSPIRRYADLLVHRALITGLGLGAGGLPPDAGAGFAELGESISQCERRAVAAERAAMDRYMAAYMADRVGAEFGARIAGVTRFGLFVELDDSGANGLIPIKTLGEEYFDHDEPGQALVGRRTGATWRLGDRVRVRLREADVATGGLLFEMLERVEAAASRPGPAARRVRAPGKTAARRPTTRRR